MPPNTESEMSSGAVAVLPSAEETSTDLRTTETAASSDVPQKHRSNRATQRSETIIVFDWDDTLLSSSWLAQHGLRLDDDLTVPEEFAVQLNQLGEAVIKTLEKASKYGEVVIITNAQAGWVERSAERFMPSVLPYIRNLRVLSARSEFESLYPNQPLAWKVEAFHRELFVSSSNGKSEGRRNVISLGDSRHERVAIHRVKSALPSALTKSIKFVEHPSIEQLTRQVDLVNHCMEEIVHHKGDLDLMLTIQLL
eukprot:gb/GECG01001538.1/.p1 GENE.gb/GECG01001538.1/~~gb/GECG01001538.1/.p1  ORF type:complete len:253 (+),score=37.74 gb/GECG01001538.1/:1-759(+)